MLGKVRDRLEALGYQVKGDDLAGLNFCLQKAVDTVKNECNLEEIPEGLAGVTVDMAAGEFLLSKKTFAPQDIAGLDLEFAVKSLQVGDTNTTFAAGEGSQTPEQRLDCLISRLLSSGRTQFSCFRRIRW